MRILIFIVLVALIGAFFLTLYAAPIRELGQRIARKLNRSFEDNKEEDDEFKR